MLFVEVQLTIGHQITWTSDGPFGCCTHTLPQSPHSWCAITESQRNSKDTIFTLQSTLRMLLAWYLQRWNGKVVRMTALLVTGDVEGKLQRFQWRAGQSSWRSYYDIYRYRKARVPYKTGTLRANIYCFRLQWIILVPRWPLWPSNCVIP